MVLAPMSGVTNRTMRALYKPFGFGLTVTEFVSSNALQYGNERTMEMIDQHGVERPFRRSCGATTRRSWRYAAKVVRECGADIVDINFGCPAPKVTKTEGGSACLRDLDRCEAIMRAVVERRRLSGDDEDAARLERGRARLSSTSRSARKSAGVAGGDAARAHRQAVLQGQGGLEAHRRAQTRGRHSRSSATAISTMRTIAMERMRESGVDAVMLGRATLGNPWLVSQVCGLMEGRPAAAIAVRAAERLRFAIVHYGMVDELGEARAVPQMRKHSRYYLKGIPGAAPCASDHAHRRCRRNHRRHRRDDRTPGVNPAGSGVRTQFTRPQR